ncbi:MAG: aminopeptidase P family protein [Gammaproteobacteria bacterium]|nr:aminopeptidase P family protein [Gammaproteobacteria bacterium]
MLLNGSRAQVQMAQRGLDVLLCVAPKHVYYLSDHHSDWMFDMRWTGAAALPRALTDAPACLFVHDVELTALAERPSWMPLLRTWAATVCGELVPHFSVRQDSEPDALERRTLELMSRTAKTARGDLQSSTALYLREFFPSDARVGCDDPDFAASLLTLCPALRIEDARPALAAIRAIKTGAELALMREAAHRNQRSLLAAAAAARLGVSWADVHRAYRREAVEQDCRPVSMYVGSGRRSMGLHADEQYTIRSGDQLCFDAMLTYENYFGDLQRTFVIGEPSGALRDAWGAIGEAAEHCYAQMRPGTSTADLRQSALDRVRARGLTGFRHAFVHGLGLDHIEHPAGLVGFQPFTLEAGMVVNMDLEFCEIGFGGVYFEDSVIIREDGPERLYSVPRELISLS